MILFSYLAAIVAANLSIAHFGPIAAPINAFLFVSLDLVAKDRLQERWQGANLARNMGLLIVAGGLLSALMNTEAVRIALASFLAFSVAASADAAVYQRLRRHPWVQRANISNIAGALTDSLLFLPLAFGVFPLPQMVLQFVAKVGGGMLWAMVLRPPKAGEV